jgi:hypothetical protein
MVSILAGSRFFPRDVRQAFAMRDDLVHELLRHLQGRDDWKLGRCSKLAESTFTSLDLPLGLTRLLSRAWVNAKYCYAGKYLLRTANEIASDPWLLVLRTCDMVPIGRAENQDVLVLRFAENLLIETGVVSRRLFYGNPRSFHPAHAYAPITRSFDEFLLRLADGKFVPSDFESARQWTELHSERTALAS